jgi:hypothetical protein
MMRRYKFLEIFLVVWWMLQNHHAHVFIFKPSFDFILECFSILDIGPMVDMVLPSFAASGKHVGVARIVAIEHLILKMDRIQGLPCVCVCLNL